MSRPQRNEASFTYRFTEVLALIAVLIVLRPGGAGAVERSCGSDALVNTAAVLCAAPSGPCNAGAVVLSTNVEVLSGGCEFDLGGRTLEIKKTLEVSGNGFVRVLNAGDISITATGKLKARGDFVLSGGVAIEGGAIELDSSGTISHAGRIDVSGDDAGSVELTAAGDITLQGGSLIQSNGLSNFGVADAKFGDGGRVQLTSTGGAVTVAGDVVCEGQSQGQGGSIFIAAATAVTIAKPLAVSGGGGGGGEIDIRAGDDVVVTRTLDAESRQGGGAGGSITLIAGDDGLGGLASGGSLTVDAVTVKLEGSNGGEGSGAGGDLVARAVGAVRFLGSGMAIRASAGSTSAADGGSVSIDSNDDNPRAVGPLDGDLEVQGSILAQSGGSGGRGGTVSLEAGRDATIGASLDVSGADRAGRVVAAAGRSVDMGGTLTAAATTAAGQGGYVDLLAGAAANGVLSLGGTVTVDGGSANGRRGQVTLAGCTLAVDDGARIHGRGGVGSNGVEGGAELRLIARDAVDLGAHSEYLATPAGSVRLMHPPTASVALGPGIVFDPPVVVEEDGSFPPCATGGLDEEPAYDFDFDHEPPLLNTIAYSSGATGTTAINAFVPRSSPNALDVFGNDNSPSTSYIYFVIYQVSIPITAATVFEYYVRPLTDAGRFMAVDLEIHGPSGFLTNLRDSGATDQYGVAVHPAAQGPAGTS